jgi:alpha-L-fucosidase 2
LPALPDALPGGNIRGVCARGGFELGFAWSEGKLQQVEVLSKAGQPCKLVVGDQKVEFDTTAGETYRFDGNLTRL